MKTLALSLALVIAGAAAAVAQTVPVNPTRLAFTSEDHNGLARYDVGFFSDANAIAPIQTQAVPVAEVSGSPAEYTLLLARPSFGRFVVKARAVAVANGQDVASAWSNASPPFDLSPRAPVVTAVR